MYLDQLTGARHTNTHILSQQNQPEPALEDPPLSNYFVGVVEGVGEEQKVNVAWHRSLVSSLSLLMFETVLVVVVVAVAVALLVLSEKPFVRPLL